MRAIVPRLLAALSFAAFQASGNPLEALDTDGVYTWRVAATDEAPPWCCASWNRGAVSHGACNLDHGHSGYGVRDEYRDGDGVMQIYAMIDDGAAERIRTLSPRCKVRSSRTIIDLGMVDVDDSLGWLQARVEADDDALPAIAVHRGRAAYRYLVETADTGSSKDLRVEAIFWLAQTRIAEAAGDVERLMFEDPSSDIRKHAAFALAESKAEDRAGPLIRQGREDDDPGVRSEAWFWLAQTGYEGSENAIRSALANDRDADVREDAVFALSELPGERAVDALFEVLRDRRLPREVREQALFWLVQSDSERAYEYLDRLFAGAR